VKMSTLMRCAVVGSLLAATIPLSAYADRGDFHDRGGFRDRGDFHDRGGFRDRGGERWHGDIRVFHERDFDRWRGGFWHHGFHDGRLGWWWVVTGLWFFYPAPIYPYPDPYTPPVVVVPQTTPPVAAAPPPPQYWYYCEPAKEYYPYVASCPVPWKAVPATPSGAPTQ
jgi:hypothetical protein